MLEGQEMTRRDFSLGGLKGLAVGAMASMGCARKVESAHLEPGTKVRATRYNGEVVVTQIDQVHIAKTLDSEFARYACEVPAPDYFPPGFKNLNMFTREQIEVIS
jgi:hypothetical protein